MGYAEERLVLWQRLQKQSAGQALAAALRIGTGLRYQLGTSLADLRVPFAVDPAIEAAVGVAARDLLFLLCLRHRAALRDEEYDRLLLLDGFDPQRQRPASFSPPPTVARAGVAQAFLEAPEIHPALDSATLAAWIGPARPGRALVGIFHSLFRRALEEERSCDNREPTPYLALLAMRATLPERAWAELKTVSVAQPVGRLLQGAVAAGMLVALRLAARESGALESPSGNRTAAGLTPLVWLQAGRLLADSGVQAHGVAFFNPVIRIDELVDQLDAPGAIEAAARGAARWSREGEHEVRAGRAVAHAAIRSELLSLIRLVEQGKAPSLQLDGLTMAQLYGQPGALERMLAASDRRKDLSVRLKELARACARPQDRDRIEALAAVAREYREDEPARCLPKGLLEREFGKAVAALAVDQQLERALYKAQAALTNRSGQEREGGITEEHDRGRLYLLAPDGPILKARTRAPLMGHLFCDVKDFTRRTAFLKEAVVSDFLQREFYAPILTAAARHYRGASHLGDRGGIYLNNLLGDAVSVSGEVSALVELAHDIRAALQSYARRLDSEATGGVVARSVAEAEQRHAKARAQARSDRERARLAEEQEAELALIRGEKLEAGIFISYGAAPEVATFDDAVFGHIKVSIAEKINESARGTARNGGVRARVDALVAQARSSRVRGDVSCPLSVLIGAPLTIPVPVGEEADVRACLSRGERNVAEGILLESVRRLLDQLPPEAEWGGDIYNGGAALSDEALQAYLAARAKDLLFLRRDLPVPSLHASLQQQFVFPMPQIGMVAGVSHTTGGLEELFVYVGRVRFRGFERGGGLGVWEIVPAHNALFSLIARHHVPQWLQEHERDGEEPSPEAATRAMSTEPPSFRGTGSGP